MYFYKPDNFNCKKLFFGVGSVLGPVLGQYSDQYLVPVTESTDQYVGQYSDRIRCQFGPVSQILIQVPSLDFNTKVKP